MKKIIVLKGTHYVNAGEITLSLYGTQFIEATEENLQKFEKYIKGGFVEILEEEVYLARTVKKPTMPPVIEILTEVLGDEDFEEHNNVERIEEKAEDVVNSLEGLTPIVEAVDYESMTKKEIIEILTEKGIEHNARSTKEELISLLA